MLADRKRNDPFFSTVNCFELLPDEIILLIFSQLDPISLARSMMVLCSLFDLVVLGQRIGLSNSTPQGVHTV